MYEDVLNRPMFQTPQQRQGGGIMAGVAPINMQDGGEVKLFGKDGILFDPTSVADWGLAAAGFIPYAGQAVWAARGAKALKAATAAAKAAKGAKGAKGAKEAKRISGARAQEVIPQPKTGGKFRPRTPEEEQAVLLGRTIGSPLGASGARGASKPAVKNLQRTLGISDEAVAAAPKAGRSPWIGKIPMAAGTAGAGIYGYGKALLGDEEVTEEVIIQPDEDPPEPPPDVDEGPFFRQLFDNLSSLPQEFGETVLNSMEQIKTDPDYRRAMISAFGAMTKAKEGYVPFNSLTEATEAYYKTMDDVKAGRTNLEESFDFYRQRLPEQEKDQGFSDQDIINVMMKANAAGVAAEAVVNSITALGGNAFSLFQETEYIHPETGKLVKMPPQIDLIIEAAQRATNLSAIPPSQPPPIPPS